MQAAALPISLVRMKRGFQVGRIRPKFRSPFPPKSRISVGVSVPRLTSSRRMPMLGPRRSTNSLWSTDPRRGGHALRYRINEIVYSIGLWRTARRFKADLALMDTGATPVFMLALFKLFGIRVVSILHNTLWPAHFPPHRRRDRMLRWLDRIFWRHGAAGVMAVSPECERQVRAEGTPPHLSDHPDPRTVPSRLFPQRSRLHLRA